MSSYLTDGYHHEPAALAPVNERISFIRRTYLHLAVAVTALVGVEAVLLEAIRSDGGRDFLRAWFGNPVSLLVIIGLFIAGGFLARYMARASMPPAVKYLGLAMYTMLEAIFLLPILYYATVKFGQKEGIYERWNDRGIAFFGNDRQ